MEESEDEILAEVSDAVNELPDDDRRLVRQHYYEGRKLADIAVASANQARSLLRQEPRVALLSFSTKGSAAHPRAEMVRQAVELVRGRAPDLMVDGELQFDAAVDPEVAALQADVQQMQRFQELKLNKDRNLYQLAPNIREAQARERAYQVKVSKFPFRANGRAMTLGSFEGEVKILADASTDRILGVHILGPHAGDLIAEAAAAMEFGASAEDLARTCHAHPTLAEVLREAALAVADRAIHF